MAKHGNRAMTSLSGSSDAIEAFGVQIDFDPAGAAEASRRYERLRVPLRPGLSTRRCATPARRVGRSASGPRSTCSVRSRTRPGAPRQLLGVGDAVRGRHVAEVAAALGTERAFVVHGDGVDELPLDGTGVIYDVGPTA